MTKRLDEDFDAYNSVVSKIESSLMTDPHKEVCKEELQKAISQLWEPLWSLRLHSAIQKVEETIESFTKYFS